MDCRKHGFTLLEVTISLTIIATLAGFTLPRFNELITATRLGTQVRQFSTAYSLARSEAIKKSQTVTLCPQINNRCGDSSNWSNGWIAFTDINQNTIADGSEIIRIFDPLLSDYHLQPNTRVSALIFLSSGQVRKKNGSLPMVTFSLCAPQANNENMSEKAREMVISGSGRMRLQHGRNNRTRC